MLPFLEYDGKMLFQSMTIARFVAREVGLAGKNNWESALCDMHADTATDVIGSRSFKICLCSPIAH